MKERILGYDLARALAVIGMVIVNFKVVMGATDGPGWLKFFAGLLEGRAAATFVILAGVGVSMLTKDARKSSDPVMIRLCRNKLIKRAVLLFLIGLSYSALWPADILHFYGIYILIGAFLITSSDKTLISMSAFFAFIFVLLLILTDYETGWNWETLHYSGFYTFNGMIRHILYNGFHPVFPWAAFLFIGMWLGRQDVSVHSIRKRILVFSVITVAVSEMLSILMINYVTNISPAEYGSDIAAMFGTKPMPPVPLYLTAAGGTAVSVIMLCVMLMEKFKDPGWLKPLVNTGQLALTLYVAHVVIGMGSLYFMGRLFNQTITYAIVSACIFSISAIIFSHSWRIKYRTGPLEWIFRKVSEFKITGKF
ncbi:MAG: DUF418 domain-containing protein [bacterium]|nr:DUF418 domain-containing protein [bacterium]